MTDRKELNKHFLLPNTRFSKRKRIFFKANRLLRNKRGIAPFIPIIIIGILIATVSSLSITFSAVNFERISNMQGGVLTGDEGINYDVSDIGAGTMNLQNTGDEEINEIQVVIDGVMQDPTEVFITIDDITMSLEELINSGIEIDPDKEVIIDYPSPTPGEHEIIVTVNGKSFLRKEISKTEGSKIFETCGNNICGEGETEINCPVDCDLSGPEISFVSLSPKNPAFGQDLNLTFNAVDAGSNIQTCRSTLAGSRLTVNVADEAYDSRTEKIIINIPKSLTQIESSIDIRCSDERNNEGVLIYSVNLTDKEGPAIRIVSIEPGIVRDKGDLTLKAEVSDTFHGGSIISSCKLIYRGTKIVEMSPSDGQLDSPEEELSVSAGPMVLGNTTLKITCKDSSNNENSLEKGIYVASQNAPAITNVAVTKDLTTKKSITILASVNAGLKLSYCKTKINGNTYDLQATDGTYNEKAEDVKGTIPPQNAGWSTLIIECADVSGDLSEYPKEIIITDVSEPSVLMELKGKTGNNWDNYDNIILHILADDTSSGNSKIMACSITGVTTENPIFVAATKIEINKSIGSLNTGKYTIKTTCSDEGGNQASSPQEEITVYSRYALKYVGCVDNCASATMYSLLNN